MRISFHLFFSSVTGRALPWPIESADPRVAVLGVAVTRFLQTVTRKILVNETGVYDFTFNPSKEHIYPILPWPKSYIPRDAEVVAVFMRGGCPPASKYETVNVTIGKDENEPLALVFDRDKHFIEVLPQDFQSKRLKSWIAEAPDEFRMIFDHYDLTTREAFDWLYIADLFFRLRCQMGNAWMV
jgi:hypothetical protein